MTENDPLYKNIKELVKIALTEDVGFGDITSLSCLEPKSVTGTIAAKSEGTLSGIKPALMTFLTVDSANIIRPLKQDGDQFKRGDIIFEFEGFNQTILTAERTALNFLGRLSGVATLTAQFVKLMDGTSCEILDTRKTTPGLRLLEKEAVKHGGGMNHRIGLFDMILIKDNHIASVGSITSAVNMAREYLATSEFRLQFKTKAEAIQIEVEITTEDQLKEALACNVDRLLLDNQSIEALTELVTIAKTINPDIALEASGNVSLDNAAAIAQSGVDFISIGALTHSASTADFSLNLIE